MQLNEKQQVAVDAIMSGENVFLTSSAGCGKSFIIKYLTEQGYPMVLAAPTGIAALNIGGITLHSLFTLPIGLPSMEDWTKVGKKVRNLFSGKNPPALVIDECSMITALTLDIIDKKLQLAANNEKPFGGVQVITVGDFLQLEPIIGNKEKKYYHEQYRTPYCFGAKSWNFKEIMLTQVMRQEGKRQPAMLNAIRTKDKRCAKALELLQNEAKKYDLREQKLTLCCYNQDADNINQYHYAKVEGEEFNYFGEFTGTPFKDNELLVDRDIKLKVGAKVLIKANDPDGSYVNGDRGVVLACGVEDVTVQLDNGGLVKVKPFSWEKVDYVRGIKGLSKVPVATFTQIPIRLGYAISAHSSQGTTLDEAAIDIGRGAFSAGQTYVMLSRVRDLSKLSFVRSITLKDIIVHEDAQSYYIGLAEEMENVDIKVKT